MNKINHTPGPWEVHEGDDYIVVLRGDETTEQGIRVDNIEDARLTASAPDLLAALIACRQGVATPISDHPWAIKQRKAHALADAAIAKAVKPEGQT